MIYITKMDRRTRELTILYPSTFGSPADYFKFALLQREVSKQRGRSGSKMSRPFDTAPRLLDTAPNLDRIVVLIMRAYRLKWERWQLWGKE